MAQAINFPNSPTLNEIHKDWNGIEWICKDATFGDVRWARSSQSSTITAGDVLYDPTLDPSSDKDNVQDALVEHGEKLADTIKQTTGLIEGAYITKVTDISFQVATGTGIVVYPVNTDSVDVAWTNTTVTLITSPTQSEIGQTNVCMDVNGAIIQIPNLLTSDDTKQYIVLGVVYYVNNIITDIANAPLVTNRTATDATDLMVKSADISGVEIMPITAPQLSIFTTPGTLFYPGINWHSDVNNPNIIDIDSFGSTVAASEFDLLSQTPRILAEIQTIIPASYNPSGDTVAPLGGGNDATIHRMYMSGVNDRSDPVSNARLILQYGQTTYATATEARENLTADQASYNTTPEIDQMYFLGWICVTAGQTDFTDPTQTWIIPAGSSSGGGGGGGAPAVTTHDTLSNRNIADQHTIVAITNLQPELDRGGRAWMVGLNYAVGDIVVEGPEAYRCSIPHTSTNFLAESTNWVAISPAGAERGGV